MKNFRQLNAIALLFPVGVAVIELITNQTVFVALVSTAITGLLQLIIAVGLILSGRITKQLLVYWLLTIVFFVTIWQTDWYYIWLLPPFLAIYLTLILYDENENPFLTADWKHLILINYEVNPEMLKPYLPARTEIDLFDGKCYVSLVGFLFHNTRVCGIKVARHINFEEVNLRFYVVRKEGDKIKRGVVFIKEIVPRNAISTIANRLYKEHYETLPMRHAIEESDGHQQVDYGWRKNGKWNTIGVTCSTKLSEIKENSEADFITEHYFGYTKVDDVTTYEYEVAHPKWKQFEVTAFHIDVDFDTSYGAAFSFLGGLQPTSVLIAEGSSIQVKNKLKLKTADDENT